MSKNKHKKHKGKKKGQSGWQPASDADRTEMILVEIEQQLDLLAGLDEGAHAGPIWGAVHKLLLKTTADPVQVVHIITQREIDLLRALMQHLRDGTDFVTDPKVTADEDSSEDGTPSESETIPPEVLKGALRAFRKRLKLTRLDHESRLGVGPMSSGRKADFDIIMAPYEFPTEVWEALANQGKLERMGPGFYKLAVE